jgi:uncharacterized protein YcbK (DUF882 family)
MRMHLRPLAFAFALTAAAPLQAQLATAAAPAEVSADTHAGAATPGVDAAAREAVFGRSGALRVLLLRSPDALEPALVQALTGGEAKQYRWLPQFGTRSELLGEPAFAAEPHVPATPGVWRLDTGAPAAASPFVVITEVPFSAKRGGVLNGYRIGTYPTEGSGRSDVYAPPTGFIEVTPENQDLQLSEHFRLRQFLTKDQFRVWPKYAVVRLALIDKLELVLQELNRMGVRADRMHVMSGFRTPQYNGPGEGGRARLSRHTYGDAADVWVDNDANGYMDDLNGDGRIDVLDAQVMLRAVDRVEQKHPELVGGAGLYSATSAHGPFIHIDVRGGRSRW